MDDFKSVGDFNDFIRGKATEDEDFRSRLLADPREVLENELDISIPDDFRIEVHEEAADTAHLVIPPSAAIAEAEMASIAGGGRYNTDWGWCSPI